MYLLSKELAEFAKVKSHTRKGKKGTYIVREFDRRNKQKKITTNAVKIVGGLAIMSTLGIGGYKALQAKTLKNIPKSANWVKSNFNKYSDEIVLTAKEAKQKSAVIAMPGLWTDETPAIVSMLGSNLKYKGKVIYNPIQSTIKNMPKTKNSNLQLGLIYKHELEQQVKLGYNPVAREAAARAYALHKKYPDKNIVLFGHSWGGNTGNEAAEILKNIDDFDNDKLKLLTLGSQHYRLLSKSNVDRLDIVDAYDNIHTALPYKGVYKQPREVTKDINKSHYLYSYVKNFKSEIKEKLAEWNE